MNEKTCTNCIFLQHIQELDSVLNRERPTPKCARYPSWVTVRPEHFCGEFKPKEQVL